MEYGIYCAYWEKEWGGHLLPYLERCSRLGFDVVEVRRAGARCRIHLIPNAFEVS